MKRKPTGKYNERNFETRMCRDETDVIDFYDDYADSWDRRFEDTKATKVFMRKRLQSFMSLLNDVSPGGVALELGVGTGVYLDRISKKFHKIYAVDGSSRMLDILSAKIKKEKIDNVIPVHANVLNISQFSNGSVDIIYFFGLLEHIVHTDRFLSEIYRVLKKNGRVIVVTPNGSSPWYRLRKKIRRTGKHCSTDHYYTVKEISELFLTHRFGLEKLYLWGAVPAGLKNNVLVGLLRGIESFFERVPVLSRFLGGITACFTKSS